MASAMRSPSPTDSTGTPPSPFRARSFAVARVTASVTALVAVLVGVMAVAGGCKDASRVDAPGNDVVDDTRDQPRPPANPDPPSSADAAPADAYPEGAPDGYAPLSACGGCTCAAPSSYCFGGGSPGLVASTPAGDASLPACAIADPAGTAPGCYAVPSACAATPTCECLLAALQPRLACYLVCAAGDPASVYCPSP